MDPTDGQPLDVATLDATASRSGDGATAPLRSEPSPAVTAPPRSTPADAVAAVNDRHAVPPNIGPGELAPAVDQQQAAAATFRDTGSSSLVKGLVRQARPRQWIKNLLVFVAPAAAGVLLHWHTLSHAAAAFGIFCIAASGTYFLNDAIDVESDRLHPTKRFRPVASGVVPVRLAFVMAVVLLVGAVGLGALLAGYHLAVVMALYGVINLGYSMGLKNEPIVDLALVSAGFVLRAIAGGVATGVTLSDWFIIVASFGSLLIVTGKRSGEQALLAGTDVDQRLVRQTLGAYTPDFLRSVRLLSAAVTVTAYCLWAFERAGQLHADQHPIWFQLTIVPFVIALLHILRVLDSGAGAAPEELAIHDHRLQIYGVCWITFFAIATYT